MEVAGQETVQVWERGKIVLIGLLAATAVRFMDIHNEVIFIFNALFFLGLFMYVKASVVSLPYPGISLLLLKISDFMIVVTGFLTATIITNMTTSFLSTDGTITLRTSNKLIIFLILLIAIYNTLPKYVTIPDLDKRLQAFTESKEL
jgi:hypothetical protein